MLYVLRHTSLQYEVGISPVAHHLGQLQAEIHDGAHVGKIVVGIVVCADAVHGTICFLPEVAPAAILHERAVGRSLERNHPTVHTAVLRFLSGGGTCTLGQTVQFFLRGQVHEPFVGIVQFVL